MKVLVTGGGGQVGEALGRADWPGGWRVSVEPRAALDIADAAAVRRAIDAHGPDLIVNAAAYTAVDRAESDSERAFQVNRDGPHNLAAACADRGARLIHVSTDYVFDGAKDGPYVEDDQTGPLNVYGASKLAGEQAVAAALVPHVILRTSWVYGQVGANFVRTMLRLFGERERLGIVADQTGAPTSADDLARAIVAVARALADGSTAYGTYHFTGGGVTTWHGFAKEIHAVAAPLRPARVLRIDPIATIDYPTPARRPANSRLDCAKIERAFAIAQAPWQSGVPPVVRAIIRATEAPR